MGKGNLDGWSKQPECGAEKQTKSRPAALLLLEELGGLLIPDVRLDEVLRHSPTVEVSLAQLVSGVSIAALSRRAEGLDVRRAAGPAAAGGFTTGQQEGGGRKGDEERSLGMCAQCDFHGTIL